MWTVLSPQGRVALLGHELGHDANDDWRHGLWLGSAINTLGEWHLTTRMPGGHDALANYIVPVVLSPLGAITWLAWRLLYRVTRRNGQCAEYRADLFGLRAGGTTGALDLAEADFLAPSFRFWIRRTTREALPDRLADLRDYAQTIPPTERERIRRAAARRLSRIDATHPPDWLRHQLIIHTPPTEPAIAPTQDELDAIAAELIAPEARAIPRTRKIRSPYTRIVRVSQ
jgi:Zn-dependent protease with chaperone function